MDQLFKDANGTIYGPDDIYKKLILVGADDCETLFIHSDVMFGMPVEGFNKKKYLCTLYEVIQNLGVKNIIIPTFTYSFCNNEIYDVAHSKTSMGALNEYIRKLPGRYRTHDPLLSLSVPDSLKEKFKNCGENSLGNLSGLDTLHGMDGVKFLFLGARLGDCFTYTHYVEKMLCVPYRFDMKFKGTIIDENGKIKERIQYIHTACFGVKTSDYYYFEDELQEQRLLKKELLGDKFVSCISEKDAYNQIADKIERNIFYFLDQPFTESDLAHKYTYGGNGKRVTHC